MTPVMALNVKLQLLPKKREILMNTPSAKADQWELALAFESDLYAEIQTAPWMNPFYRAIGRLTAAIGSNTGTQRERNEDRIAVAKVVAPNKEVYGVAIVCDGVGGSAMGDEAAALAITYFLTELAIVEERLPIDKLLSLVIRTVDDRVQERLRGKGVTTLSVILATMKGEFAAASVGDSRLYSWAPDDTQLEQVSIDDTVENELNDLRIKNASLLDERGLRGALTQAIGESGRTCADLKIQLYSRSRFLKGVILATDGVWKVAEQGFIAIGKNTRSAYDIIRRSLAYAGWIGGVDNASIIAIENLDEFARNFSDISQSRASHVAEVWLCDGRSVFRYVSPQRQLNQREKAEKKTKRRQCGHKKEKPPVKNAGELNLLDESSRERAGQSSIEIIPDDGGSSKK